MKTGTIFTPTIIVLFLLCLFFADVQPAYSQDELSVMEGWVDWSDRGNMLARYLNREALGLLDKRSRKIASLDTREDWINRRNEVREILIEMVGPFPGRTPLTPVITGTIRKAGFRMEKIVFESQPGFFVTGALFIPENLHGKTPAILNPIGHSDGAFRRPLYQDVILNLVHKGFIVLTYDPAGQGERIQYYNPETGRSDVGGSTAEHSHAGVQCFLTGSGIARHMIWDGIRAVDYLLTRPEVDPDRIGVTGLSGGGTLSSYLGAFDERIHAAAPTCYITGFRRLLTSIGPQDAEQNFAPALSRGIDHADLLEVRAPKPTLLVATTRDFFSIQGARETAGEVEKAFEAFGEKSRFSIAEDDFEHGYTKKTREAVYAFFQEALRNPGDSSDQSYPYLTFEELQVTKTGQVLTALNSRNVFDLNRSDAEKALEKLDLSRGNPDLHLQNVKVKARELSGFRIPVTDEQAVFRGRLRREGYTIEKFVLDGKNGIPVPFLLFIPEEGEAHPAVIYCDSRGKAAGAGQGGIIEWLVKRGYCVASPDLSGTGETEDGRTIFNPFRALLIGRSIPGIQAGDIIRIFNFLKARTGVKSESIYGIGVRDAGPALLHAALFEPGIAKICLIESLTSYKSIAVNPLYNYDIALLVPSILTAYDLPDLAAGLAPRALLLVNAADKTGLPAPRAWVEEETAFVQKIYGTRGSRDNFKINLMDETQSYDDIFGAWLGQ